MSHDHDLARRVLLRTGVTAGAAALLGVAVPGTDDTDLVVDTE